MPHYPSHPGDRPAGPGRPRYRILLATADDDIRVGARALLEDCGCEVVAASGGVDCLGLLRAVVPDAVVLVPPLFWGGEEGVLAVLQSESRFREVVALVFTGPDDHRLPPVAFRFLPGIAPLEAQLERLTGRLAHWLWCRRTVRTVGPGPAQRPAAVNK